MTDFTKQVIEIVSTIPYGKVMTYGDIASCAGNPRGARQVSRILHSLSSKYQLPWHRVINHKGGISLTGEGGFMQESLLIQENINVVNHHIDLTKYRFKIQ